MPSDVHSGSSNDQSSVGRPSLDALLGEAELKTARNLDRAVVGLLLTRLKLAGDATTLTRINQEQHLPFIFGACHVHGGAALRDLLFRPTKTRVWESLKDLESEYPDTNAAVVFNTNSYGLWVMHHCPLSAYQHTRKRMLLLSTFGGVTVIEPFTEFCSMVKQLQTE